ncbi:MAG: hypothetical protein IT371_29945 [Deltaproteobacteria bacterium]|nr:hypothetical protein [Deltaproteobacteria bacterium]
MRASRSILRLLVPGLALVLTAGLPLHPARAKGGQPPAPTDVEAVFAPLSPERERQLAAQIAEAGWKGVTPAQVGRVAGWEAFKKSPLSAQEQALLEHFGPQMAQVDKTNARLSVWHKISQVAAGLGLAAGGGAVLTSMFGVQLPVPHVLVAIGGLATYAVGHVAAYVLHMKQMRNVTQFPVLATKPELVQRFGLKSPLNGIHAVHNWVEARRWKIYDAHHHTRLSKIKW